MFKKHLYKNNQNSYFFRNGMHQMHPMQMGGGGNSGPQSPQAHNNWGCLDDLAGVNYGQPPPGMWQCKNTNSMTLFNEV